MIVKVPVLIVSIVGKVVSGNENTNGALVWQKEGYGSTLGSQEMFWSVESVKVSTSSFVRVEMGYVKKEAGMGPVRAAQLTSSIVN